MARDEHGDLAALLGEDREALPLAGIPLGRWYPELEDCLLIAVTEKRTREDIERLASCLDPATHKAAAIHA